MSASPRTRRHALALAAAVLAVSLALAALARAQGSPTPGGTVPSTIALSLGEPTPFTRAGPRDVYTATIHATVTATDVPVRLSLADGEATHGRRLGHMVGGASILSPALDATAGAGPFRSLDAAVPAPLKTWHRPLAGEKAKIRLRQEAPDARALRNHGKLLLVTLTAGGP
jgi:hypothetical protein